MFSGVLLFRSAGVKATNPLRNTAKPQDVDGDNVVAPLDALLIINFLNSSHFTSSLHSTKVGATGLFQKYYDVDGDGDVAPLDALLIINALNSGTAGEGEGLLASATPAESEPATFATTSELSSLLDALASDAATSLQRRRGF